MQSDEDLNDFTEASVSDRCTRRTYLITCSQVDKTKFPTRESFGDTVADAFNSAPGKVEVLHWACCLEQHKISGEHYHLSIKLSGPRRWKPIKTAIMKSHGAVLHFSEKHDNYYSAFKYVCKDDEDVCLSPGHPNLKEIGSPKTKKCIKAFREKAKKRKSDSAGGESSSSSHTEKTEKIRRLSNLDVAEFVVKNNITKSNQLFAAAKQRKNEGNKDLANYVMSRSAKKLEEILENAWKMEKAEGDIERQNKTRIEILRSTLQEECVIGCNGQWFECANEVLQKNKLHPNIFAAAVRDLLEKGRGKYRNVMIVGPANCAKTFILSPLQIIFKTFSNPSNDKYAWIGAENSECIFLNDFRWSSELIAWKELLLLLEGQKVHLPSPKNHYATDICIEHDIPIFATGKSRITYVGRYQSTDERETEMMSVRWKVFDFTYQISENEQKNVPPCGKCFAKLVFLGEL